MTTPKPNSDSPIHLGEIIPPMKKAVMFKKIGQKLIQVCNAVLSLKVLSGNGQAKVSIGKDGGLLIDLNQISVTGGSVGNWHWAASGKKYDRALAYTVDEAVIVGKSNPVVALGATAGFFICVKNAKAGLAPIWPPVGMTEDEAENNPDDPRIYWHPFYVNC